ncbi:hypothetical protein EYF80_001207 [Liparis tanakae]|uniref:Uncharacterized protein n=1 Tax=Liparis tanakae TaxID=230148 RepID=A0A4Z2JDR1_9TELE|nr:hypothetical protein EYF80_001207 [Liparis tanakae]
MNMGKQRFSVIMKLEQKRGEEVIDVARIRHLLDVDPEWPVLAGVKLDDAVFDHVLQRQGSHWVHYSLLVHVNS